MARENEVLAVMQKLVIASAEDVGLVMSAAGVWKTGVSATNNSSKTLKDLVALNKLEAIGKSVHRLPGCRSEWGDHSKLLTRSSVRFIIKNPECLIRREVSVPAINRRADAIILLRRGDTGACLVFEQLHSETKVSFSQKREQWMAWKDSRIFLSQQFGINVPSFEVISSDELDQFLG